MKLFETAHDFTTSLRKALDDIDPQWATYRGLIVPGSHTPHQVEEKLAAIKRAREEKDPFLGICFGHQLAALEYARNVMGISNATSEELDESGFHVISKRQEGLKVGEKDGETYWSNYEVNFEWDPPRNYFLAAFHPEYQSSKEYPHPVLKDFVTYASSM